jgi:hypothetical protein
MINIPDKLLEKIKEILVSEPFDIFNEENETITEGNLELVDSRYDTDSLELEDRYIGSANIFIAASLLTFAMLNEKSIRDLSDEELELSSKYWEFVVDKLKSDRFIRDDSELVKEKIKLVIDNT